MSSNLKRFIYADNSATTKTRKEVLEAINSLLKDEYGNPSSVHRFGKKSRKIIEEAREKISLACSSDSENIIFTSGGTEANNLVIFGLVKSLDELNLKKKKHIITSSIEHSSIKEPLEYLEKNGWKVTWLKVDKQGFVDVNQLKSEITPETLLVSIIHANNEIGTIQNLKEISDITNASNVLFHADCVQSFGKVALDFKNLNIDFASISAHKIYGPKGIGVLYAKNKNNLKPLLLGGGQENALRPGTENVFGIVGFGVASELIADDLKTKIPNLVQMQKDLIQKISTLKNIDLTGPDISSLNNRIPGHVSFCVENINGESIVLQMDLRGIAISSGSACSSNKLNDDEIKPSHVIQSLGLPEKYLKGSVRISLGIENSFEDVKSIYDELENILIKLDPKILEKIN